MDTQTLSEQLRNAIVASGMSVNRIAIKSGVHQPALCRFMNHKGGLHLETIDRISITIGVRLVRDQIPA
jgi:DNA-binding phage protein